MTTHNTTDVTQLVCGMLAKILNVDPAKLAPDTRIDDLGVDSLDVAELAAMLAEQGIDFDKDEAHAAETIADLGAIARRK